MGQPYNYSLNIPNPADMALKVAKLGQMRAQTNAVSQQSQQLQAEQNSLQKLISEMPDNPTLSQQLQLVNANPELKEIVKMRAEQMPEEKKQALSTVGTKVYSALSEGKDSVAVDFLRQKAEQYKNAGDLEQAKAFSDEANFTELNPRVAEYNKLYALNAIMGDDFLKSVKHRKTIEGDIKKRKAETEKVLNEIIIKKRIPEPVAKRMYDLNDKSSVNQSIHTNANELMNDLDEIDRKTGIYQAGLSAFNKFWGTGGEGEVFRTRFDALINENIMGKRKPGQGPMSDKDYDVLRATAPGVDSSPEQVKAYLGALIRFSSYAAKKDRLKSEFLSENMTDGKARTSFDVGGYKVKKGDTFLDFMDGLGEEVYLNASLVPKRGIVDDLENKYKKKPIDTTNYFNKKYLE